MDFEKIKRKLKKEFIGIDTVIDRILDSVKTWYNFDGQRRPTIVNLWGMTGSGKTHLINRVIEELDLENDFWSINMGEHKKIAEDFKEIGEEYDGDATGKNKIAFLLDDFHVCKTTGQERVESNIGVIWDLLDSGKVKVKSRLVEVWDEYNIRREMGIILKHGLLNKKIKDCSEILDMEDFLETLDSDTIRFQHNVVKALKPDGDGDAPTRRKPELTCMLNLEKILRLDSRLKQFNFDNDILKAVETVKDLKFKTLMDFYMEGIKTSNSFTWQYDFSKSIIFLTGNIDEMYGGHTYDMDDDESPDALKSVTKQITFNDLKNVLVQHYFRPEHISRLGSNHIIYQAFSTEEYKKIILHYLKEMNNSYGTKITFDKSVVDIVFSECVIASQGVRPILSGINYMIENNMADIIKDIKKRQVNMLYDENEKEIVLGRKRYPVLLINRCHDYEKDGIDFARTVVHEAGHAFLHYKLTGRVPEGLIIKNNSNTYGGYVIPTSFKLITEDVIKQKAGFYLGGLLAEEFIFGKASNGASMDLEYATEEIQTMLTKLGLGNQLQVTKHSEDKHAHDGFAIKDRYQVTEDILQEMAKKGRRLLTENKKEFSKLCKLIHMKCHLTEKDFLKFWKMDDNCGDYTQDLEVYNELIGV
jgi:hypothetical protein